MISLNKNTLGLFSIFRALHSILGAISVTSFLIKKLNAFDQFLKRKCCEKCCWITTSFTGHISWPPSALQAMDHWYIGT